MRHTEISGTDWSITSVGWRVELCCVCGWKTGEIFEHVWAHRVLSSRPGRRHITPVLLCALSPPATGQGTAQPPTGTRTATCWADVRNPPAALCAAGITLCTSTHGHVKKNKTLADHVPCSMPSSCPTGWKGQRKSGGGSESTWLFLYKQNAKFLLNCPHGQMTGWGHRHHNHVILPDAYHLYQRRPHRNTAHHGFNKENWPYKNASGWEHVCQRLPAAETADFMLAPHTHEWGKLI